jgi:hypothetical protein
VTLCTGERESCRTAIEPREELGAEMADGVPVLVMVESTEGPGPELSGAARAFWTTVQLTTGEPAWLPPLGATRRAAAASALRPG